MRRTTTADRVLSVLTIVGGLVLMLLIILPLGYANKMRHKSK